MASAGISASMASRRARSWRSRGGVMDSPIRVRPMRKRTVPSSTVPCSSSPSSRPTGLRALSAQTAKQPPQPWHMSGKMLILPAKEAMALKLQISRHLPHLLHAARSREGTSSQALLLPSTCGGRKRWRLGASTSVSTATRGLFQTLAREAATLVLPAPPLPLAMAIRIRVLYLLGASAKGNSPFWKRSTASRTVPLTSWQTLMPAAFRASKALGPT